MNANPGFSAKNQNASQDGRRVSKPNSNDATQEITFSELRQILARRWLTLCICATLGLVAAAILSLFLPKRYEASGQLSINFEPSQASSIEALAQVVGVSDPTKLQTQVSILQTDSVIWEVIRRLRLDQNKDALPREHGFGRTTCETAANEPAEAASVRCRRLLLDEFRKRMHVQAIPRTEIIEIRYRSRSPELAAKVVSALGAVYVERSFQSNYRSSMRTYEWLSAQLDLLKKEARGAEERLIEYQKKSGLIVADGGQNLQSARLGALNQQVLVARSERIAQEARYETALAGDPEAMIGLTQESTLQVLHTAEVSLENQYAQLQTKFGDAYPRVIQVRDQLANAHAATQAELIHTREKIKLEFDAAARTEELVRSVFDRQKQQIFDSSEAAVQLAMLRRDVDASNELYEQVLKRMRLGGITAGMNKLDVSMIDPPTIPVERIEPHPALNLLGGLSIGSLIGLGACGLLEGLDGRLQVTKLVQKRSPLGELGILPNLTAEEKLRQARLPARQDGLSLVTSIDLPGSAPADFFRTVRTALLHTNGGRSAPAVVLVTSASAGEGKSVVSTNLAAVLAQMNRRVLLVDGDLRGDGFSNSQMMQSDRGLSELLEGPDGSSVFRSQSDLPFLAILPAGKASIRSADLLDSPRMRELIASWRENFDHVVIEGPHVLERSDALVLATMADGVVVSVRAERGRGQNLRRVLDLLTGVGAHVNGAVMTDLQENGRRSRSGSRSS